jgi:DNA-binding PucR family transcriptional regulator
MDGPAVAELMSQVAEVVARRAAAVSADVYDVIVREIPQLREDKPLLALLASSVDSNVDTCLQIMQHQIDLTAVQAPAAAVEYARRLAQRGTLLTALLRAYRVGHARFFDGVFTELARQTDDAELISATTLRISKIMAGYIDQTSEEMVASYTRERENWLRNRSAARAARIRDLLAGERIDVSAAEATLGYRLHQYHVGLVCWAGDAASPGDGITRLERAVGRVAEQAGCHGEMVFMPRDESIAWAWLPLGIRDRFEGAAAGTAEADPDIHFAFGDAAGGTEGFRITHQQAIAAQAVALAAGSSVPRVVTFSEVAPVAMMLGSADLLRAWVLSTLAGLATDDEQHARLRDTLLIFLQSGGSYKTTAERLTLHKNTVQYRIRKAEESLGHPVRGNRRDVELALQASRWLGAAVLRSALGGVAQFRHRLHVSAQVADLDAGVDLREPVDQAVQAEQQGQGDRADAGPGEQQHAERDRHQAGQDEQRPHARGLPSLEAGEELGHAADERPRGHDDDQHERGGRGPDQGDHAGRQVDQPEQQVPEDRPGGPAGEGPRGL